ncbi:fimbrial protein [Burkholderia sp. ISTR5]|uniref:fimbrial protein n=1 Tax=Burkholderia sp. ISTR5 TaxID=2500161 RepID=UPI00136EA87D|nr:fimbrial protein [Burkholderia sp. ISTR5]NBI50507.1 type 1 fimbrial protein [Burkholderia sp. ISTR5]
MQVKIIPALVFAGAAAASQVAFAADGTITFNGSVTSQTCTVVTNDFTVTLPPVSAASLKAGGLTAGATAFNIKLKDCAPLKDDNTKDDVAIKSVHAYFENGPLTDVSGNLNLEPGDAANVQVQLLNGSNQTPIKLGLSDASQGATNVPVNPDGTATLPFYARYYATGAAGAGKVSTKVVYTIAYQ